MSKHTMAKYDAACAAIKDVYENDPGERIENVEERLAYYRRVAADPQPEMMMCEIRLRAEREGMKIAKRWFKR